MKTKQELRDKIARIIYHTGCTGACCECDYSKVSDADTYCKALLKADALIAAGIGDVSEYKKHRVFIEKIPVISDEELFTTPQKAPKITQLYGAEEVENIVKERDEYKHRAENAEKDNIKYGRTLYNLAIKYVSAAHIWTIKANDEKNYIADKEICALYVIENEVKQAEKELQEEKKDEQN